MSTETWKAEFYPVAADFIEGRLVAVEHSILKWEGVSKKNLDKHNVSLNDGTIIDGTGAKFLFTPSNCALCVLYRDLPFTQRECVECPITVSRGVSCTSASDDSVATPWGSFLRNDPAPMIAVLEEARQNELRNVEK
jgi:hypothetical protein